MIGESFSEVLDEAQRGLESGFAPIHRDLAPAVLGYARGRRAPDPEGIVTETMLAVARGVKEFRGNEIAFRAWVFQICHCRIIDSHRRSQREVETQALGSFDAAATGMTPEDAVIGGSDSARIAEALSYLTADQRDVVLLRIVSDLPVKEVAAILGKGTSAVKMIQARAFEQLRAFLGPVDSAASAGHKSAVIQGGRRG